MSKKLRICYIGNAISPHIKFWAEEFAKLGHEVHVISPYNAEISGVRVHPTKTKLHKSINFLLSYFFIKGLLTKINPDIVHAHFLGKYTFLTSLSYTGFIGSVWGSDIDKFGERNILTKLMFKFILKKSSIIQVFDEATAKFLIKKYGLNRRKLYISGWGINAEKFRPIKSKKKIDLLYLRKASKKYSTCVFIEAVNLVIKKFPKTIVAIKGNKEQKQVEELIKKYNLEENIQFKDWISEEEFPNFLNSSLIYADSFYRKTPGGSIGITTTQAMSCGIPVILADNPGVDEYIKNNHNGLLYKGGDYRELADCILRLLKDKKLREKLGKNARQTAIEKLDWGKNSKKFEKKYFELCEKYGKMKVQN